MICRSCREEHKEDALVCPHCQRRTALGHRLKLNQEIKSVLIRGGLAAILILSFPIWSGPFSRFFGNVLGETFKKSLQHHGTKPKEASTSKADAKAKTNKGSPKKDSK